MGVISIGILISDSIYALNLANRLSELSGRLEIHLLRERKDILDGYILITDCSELLGESINTVGVDRYKTAEDILHEAVIKYERMSGDKFFLRKKNHIKTYSFFSKEGGSGTSSIALTFSRILSSNDGIKTLFVSGEDLSCYGAYTNKSSDELRYILKEKVDIPFDIYEYMSKDEYGVYTLMFKSNIELLLKRLDSETDFEAIVLDLGSDYQGEPQGYVYEVENMFDSRSTGDSKRKIINYSSFNEKNGDCINIVFDRESFERENEKVRILLNGSFAKGVSLIDRS